MCYNISCSERSISVLCESFVHYRRDPKCREYDMLHAFDTSKLTLTQLKDKISEAKNKDNALRSRIQ